MDRDLAAAPLLWRAHRHLQGNGSLRGNQQGRLQGELLDALGAGLLGGAQRQLQEGGAGEQDGAAEGVIAKPGVALQGEAPGQGEALAAGVLHHGAKQGVPGGPLADRCHIGTKITNPNIDYAKMAQAYGMEGFGPITDPKDLAPTFKKAIELVRKGEPAMIDVVTQPR